MPISQANRPTPAPLIRETKKALLLDADTQLEGHVTLGDLKFFDEPATVTKP